VGEPLAAGAVRARQAAPALEGVTMQLLDRGLAGHGLTSRRAPVRLSDLGAFAAAFVTNARGIAPVGQIDDLAVSVDPALMRTLARAHGSAPWAALQPAKGRCSHLWVAAR
jgi:branched-subunit amino acid aminotransferase/4-amino-4-deoxychorismate lyase